MKYKLLKDLPGYEVNNHLFYKDDQYWYCSNHPELILSDYISRILDEYHEDSDWFQPVDDGQENWRAEFGQKWYFVISDTEVFGDTRAPNFNKEWEENHYKVGNYFRTEQQAKKAAETIRAVLAYIQLPYGNPLTAPSIDDWRKVMGVARAAVQEDRE
jgi:hypothetical protein